MKTLVTLDRSPEMNIRQEVLSCVETLLGGQSAEHEILDATSAGVSAFFMAEVCREVRHIGTGYAGDFCAMANIVTGDLTLFRKIQ